MTVGRDDHEMEEGAVVPEVELAAEVLRTDVAHQPADPIRLGAQLGPGAIEGERGDVGDRDVLVPASEQLGGEM